ncbi:MAG TPA: NAD(+)/NADH kinase [Syntrophales bacterium]|nr:NAD(+)/NADH kinase [Syntrophales bacterium]
MRITRIGIVANAEKPKSPDYALRLADWGRRRGLEILLEDRIAAKVGEAGLPLPQLAASVQLLVVFGGDGTILRTARTVCTHAVPIVGVNLGSFGYLTDVNLSEMFDALEIILKGDVRIEKRMMLDVVLNEDKGGTEVHSVLNDAVINRGNLSRLVQLETLLDGRYLTTFKSDGLIISTPTGSTAYSLSAGGPIVFPAQQSIIINPICPHTLTNRPIILPADVVLKIILWTKDQGATLTLDGQVSIHLRPGDTATVRKSHFMTHLVCSPHRDYLQILRSKLGWGGLPSGAGSK